MSKTGESGRKARLVRMSRELDARLTEAATSAKMSDNEFIGRAIERALAVCDAEVRKTQDKKAREQQLDDGHKQIVALLAAMPQRRGVTRAKLEAEANSILDGDIPPPTAKIARIEKECARIRERSGDHHWRPYNQLTAEEQADQDFLADLAWDHDEDGDGDYGHNVVEEHVHDDDDDDDVAIID